MKYYIVLTLLTFAACSKERAVTPLVVGTFVKVEDCNKPHTGQTQTIAFMDGKCYVNDVPLHSVRYDAPNLYWHYCFYEFHRSGKTLLTMQNDTLILTGGMYQISGCEVAKFKLMH